MKIISITILIFITVITIIFPTPLFAQTNISDVNQKVCNRFEDDVRKLAAIMEELRRRKGITETRVAFGGIDNQIESADYWITYAAEAVAFQRAQKYSSSNQLRYSLETLKTKILKAKNEARKALND
ncbi:hypothetical protein HYW42_03620 [Candidatus Daviesbacteria bacterium]|nr:hypothetical protein [Candidatus Daviesbacteria bacterium]